MNRIQNDRREPVYTATEIPERTDLRYINRTRLNTENSGYRR